MARKTASDFFENEINGNGNGNGNGNDPDIISDNINTVKKEEEENCVKSSDSEGEDFKEPTFPPEPPQNNQDQDQQEQYAQYMMQYQQYYAQYYAQYYQQQAVAPQIQAPVNDPAYEYYTGTSTTNNNTIPTGTFEASRANRQMSAYFDPTKFQSVLSPEMQAAQKAQKEQTQGRLTAKEIEAFKKRKIEKKKTKNRWFYE